ncbi:kelch repeat-containing protein [uncultured Paenibacillus sp.]|uniref:kelch repeat-containing protein n=1 Tax=uncultured Paenibacillus sp. TaxID=227322 RepID=UPI003457F48B
MLAPRTGAAIATWNGQINVFGGSSDGRTAYEGIKRNHTYAYDPASGAWSEKKPMPTARAGAATAVVNNFPKNSSRVSGYR